MKLTKKQTIILNAVTIALIIADIIVYQVVDRNVAGYLLFGIIPLTTVILTKAIKRELDHQKAEQQR